MLGQEHVFRFRRGIALTSICALRMRLASMAWLGATKADSRWGAQVQSQTSHVLTEQVNRNKRRLPQYWPHLLVVGYASTELKFQLLLQPPMKPLRGMSKTEFLPTL